MREQRCSRSQPTPGAPTRSFPPGSRDASSESTPTSPSDARRCKASSRRSTFPTPRTSVPARIVEAALGRVERNTSRPVEAAIAADELGVLAYADPPSPSLAQNPYLDPSQGPAAGQLSPTDRAQEQFTLAATLDPSNDNALRDLEIVLRAPISNPKSDTTHTGAGDQFGHKGSGSRPAGRGY